VIPSPADALPGVCGDPVDVMDPRCRGNGDRTGLQPGGAVCGLLGSRHKELAEMDGAWAGQQPPRRERGVEQRKAGCAGLGAGWAGLADGWFRFRDAAVVAGTATAGAQQFLVVVPQRPENPCQGTRADVLLCRFGLRRVSGGRGVAVGPPRQPAPPAGGRPPVAGHDRRAQAVYPIPSRHRKNPDAAGGWISSVAATAG